MTVRYADSSKGVRGVTNLHLHISLLETAPLRLRDVEEIFLSNGLHGYVDCTADVVGLGGRGSRASSRGLGSRAAKSASVDVEDLKEFQHFWNLVWHLVDGSGSIVMPNVPRSI